MNERISYFGKRAVFISEGETCSYEELASKLNTCKTKLISNGIVAGDVVALIGDFSADTAAFILALLANENIIVPLTNETKHKHDKFYSLASIKWSIELSENGDVTIRECNVKESHPIIESLRSQEEAGLILFTSGTSGESKGAVLKASTLLERFKKASVSDNKCMRSIVFLKLDHIGGLNTLFNIIFSGGTAISIKGRTPSEVCNTIQKYRVELLPTTPTFLNMLLLSGNVERFDLSSLKLITYGTEPMPMSTLKAVNQNFPKVRLKQTYGLTELGIFSTRSKDSDSDWLEIGGHGVTTRVVDGILQIKTPANMLGYLNAPSPFTKDGYYITGDRVQVEGNYYRILGRDSEIINVGGEKVFPNEIESVLLEMSNVEEVLVYGKKNPVMGNIVCADIRLKKDESKQELVSRLNSFCLGRMEPFKVPKLVSISDQSFMSERLKKSRNTSGVTN